MNEPHTISAPSKPEKMTLVQVCRYWGVEQNEVDLVTEKFLEQGVPKSWWRNNRTFEMIRTWDGPI